jgi:hypothetical protein
MGEGDRYQKRLPSPVRRGRMSLNLEDEIVDGGGECNIPENKVCKICENLNLFG